MRSLRGALTVLCLTALFGASESFAADTETGWHHGFPFAYEEGLFDYLKFPRANLAENGVDIHFSTLVIGQSIVEGGIEEEDEISASYDLQVYLDSAKLGLWEGGYALLRAEGKTDDAGINPFTGAIIPVNFDAVVPEADGVDFEMTEWWYAHAFGGGKVEVLGGMWDLGRFFDLVPFSGPYQTRFINAHMFFNSVLLPYAPYNILGGLVILKPTKGLSITTSIGDPNSNAGDVNWFDEGDYNILHEWRLMAETFGKQSMFNLGLAYQKKDVATLADPTQTTSSNWALYGNFSQWLYQNPNNPHQAIGLFGRVGVTDGEVAIIKNHFSLGVSFDGMIPSRPKDLVGLVGWYNDMSDDLSSSVSHSSSGFELYYNFVVTPWFELSPDVQYLINPGFDKDSEDTLILGLRARILF